MKLAVFWCPVYIAPLLTILSRVVTNGLVALFAVLCLIYSVQACVGGEAEWSHADTRCAERYWWTYLGTSQCHELMPEYYQRFRPLLSLFRYYCGISI